jgi:hypothetical protein
LTCPGLRGRKPEDGRYTQPDRDDNSRRSRHP